MATPYHFDAFANEFYLRNLINNLLKNSLYYIQKNRKGEIDIWSEEKENRNVLYIKDTAQGIPPDSIDKIFDGYFTQRHNGTGLGLTFCQSVMKSFGGDITVESEYYQYVTFTLAFPKV